MKKYKITKKYINLFYIIERQCIERIFTAVKLLKSNCKGRESAKKEGVKNRSLGLGYRTFLSPLCQGIGFL